MIKFLAMFAIFYWTREYFAVPGPLFLAAPPLFFVVGLTVDAALSVQKEGGRGAKLLSYDIAGILGTVFLCWFAALADRRMISVWILPLLALPFVGPSLLLVLLLFQRGSKVFTGWADQGITLAIALVITGMIYHTQHRGDADYIGTSVTDSGGIKEIWVPLGGLPDKVVDRLETVELDGRQMVVIWKGRVCQLLDAKSLVLDKTLSFEGPRAAEGPPLQQGLLGQRNGVWLAWSLEAQPPALVLEGIDGSVRWSRLLNRQPRLASSCIFKGQASVAVWTTQGPIDIYGLEGKVVYTSALPDENSQVNWMGTLVEGSGLLRGSLAVVLDWGGTLGILEGNSGIRWQSLEARGLCDLPPSLVMGSQRLLACSMNSEFHFMGLGKTPALAVKAHFILPTGKQDSVQEDNLLACQTWDGPGRIGILLGFSDWSTGISGGDRHLNSTSHFELFDLAGASLYSRNLRRSGALLSLGNRIYTASGGERLLVVE